MYQLLLAVNHFHTNGIMHRDIKPHNILVDQEKKELKLIDYGHAEFYLPSTPFKLRVGTRIYKSPELFLGYDKYDFAVDVWAIGCVFAGLVFFRFFDFLDFSEKILF